MQETRVRSLGREGPLEKEMATHSSTLAWRIPWREEPGRLQPMGSSDTTEQLHLLPRKEDGQCRFPSFRILELPLLSFIWIVFFKKKTRCALRSGLSPFPFPFLCPYCSCSTWELCPRSETWVQHWGHSSTLWFNEVPLHSPATVVYKVSPSLDWCSLGNICATHMKTKNF